MVNDKEKHIARERIGSPGQEAQVAILVLKQKKAN